MTKTHTEEAMSKGLDEDPNDWSLRAIYADWLEEQGRDGEAAGQRWMIQHKKRPFRPQYSGVMTTNGARWWWYNLANRRPHSDGLYEDPWSDLPEDLFRKLIKGPPDSESYLSQTYRLRQRAEKALFKALGLL